MNAAEPQWTSFRYGRLQRQSLETPSGKRRSARAMKCYRIHGLTLRSEVALPAVELEASASPDLVVTYGPARRIPWQTRPGELLALHETPSSGFALSLDDDGYTIRFYGSCDFELSRDLSTLTVLLAHDADEAIVPLLLCSNVLSCILSLKGDCVLHASALQVGSDALAFIGPSGSGKSTLAAALATFGFPVITDDALRCAFDSPVTCFAGARELRLRDGSDPLLGLYDNETARSIDGRSVVRPVPTTSSRLPLGALIQPEIHTGQNVEVRRLRGSAAMLAAIAAGRIAWWRSIRIRRAQFEMLTQLCKLVPVYTLSLPSGIAFTASGRKSIHEALIAATRA
jgi:hypothetical protein